MDKKIDNKEKEYEFEVTIKLVLNPFGEDEEEARGKLAELVTNYFAETVKTIDHSEAELIAIDGKEIKND